jgi:hypothetical protein
MPLWTPSRITTALWLDAADSSTLFDATSGGSLVAADGAVARWQDKSGNARHVTQGTSGARPARKTSIQNSKDVIRFDGSADFMDSAAISAFNTDLIADFVVVVFANATTTAQNVVRSSYTSGASGNSIQLHGLYREVGLLVGHARTSAGGIIGSQASQGSGAVLGSTIWASDNTVTLRHNGTAQTAGTGATASPSGHILTRFGARSVSTADSFAAIDFCECVRVIGGIALADAEKIEGYLAWKWDTVLALDASHPYKNAAPSYGGSSPINGQSLIRPAGSAQQQLLIQGATT